MKVKCSFKRIVDLLVLCKVNFVFALHPQKYSKTLLYH